MQILIFKLSSRREAHFWPKYYKTQRGELSDGVVGGKVCLQGWFSFRQSKIMVWRPFCFKIAISSGRNTHFCFKGFVLCQWCQIDDSKTSKFRWLDLLGWVCLVDIGCHGGWPTTAHQSTTDDQQQPTNNPPKSGHRSDNQQSPTNQPIDNR